MLCDCFCNKGLSTNDGAKVLFVAATAHGGTAATVAAAIGHVEVVRLLVVAEVGSLRASVKKAVLKSCDFPSVNPR